MREDFSDFCAQLIQQTTCAAILKEDWIYPILRNMNEAAEEGHMEGAIYVKDHEALKDSETMHKLCFFLRQKGFFVLVTSDAEHGEYVRVSWDWSADKQRAVDLAEAIGDQLPLAVEGIIPYVWDIKEIMSHYFIAKLKGNHSDFRKAIDVVQSHLSEEIPEE